MNRDGDIYKLTEEQQRLLEPVPQEELTEETKIQREQMLEDASRLDGYLRGRAEAAQLQKGKGANRDLSAQG